MKKYDYFVAGRWRNYPKIKEVIDVTREAGHSAYCFIENSYSGDGIELQATAATNVEQFMHHLETLQDWHTNPTFQRIFQTDMEALKQSAALILVFPAGLSAHMELGVAYGLGIPCYGIGKPDKNETLYLMFEQIYSTVDDFKKAQRGVAV